MQTQDNRWIIDDRAAGLFRVNQRAFSDPALFEVEQREIFSRCWLYTAHESEIPNPGDFISRKVAGRPLIVLRDDEGQVQVYFNRCTHRGNIICREAEGRARSFTCFYHAWTFNLKGALIGVQGADAYAPAFQKSAMGLQSPRFDNYRGMIFVTFDSEMESLSDFLGPAKHYIDVQLDLIPEGIEIAQGAQAYSMNANWKLLVENSIDGYHFLTTHSRYYNQFLPDIGVDITKGDGRPAGSSMSIGGGHGLIETQMLASPLAEASEDLAVQRAKLIALHGEERASYIMDFNRNLFIYPNLIMIGMWRTVRTFYPVSPDYMEINAWCLLPKDGDAASRRLLFDNFISFLGPGGFGTPDDVAGLEGCQQGFAAVGEDAGWSDISRGMASEQPGATDELQMRGFWRRWNAAVTGERGPVNCTDRAALPAAAE